MPSTRRSEAEALASVKTILSRSDANQLINRRSSKGITLLHAACIAGHPSVIQCLIQARLSLELDGLYEGWSPLMLAARGHHIDCVKLLIESGADPQPLFEQDPDQTINQTIKHSKKRAFKYSCLPLDPSLRKTMLTVARAASVKFQKDLHCVMSNEPMLVDMPTVLIDIVIQYLTYG